MMLSNEDIKRAIERGDLAIDPFSPERLRAAGVTLTLGPHLLRPVSGKTVDIKNGILPDYDQIEISSNSPYELKPHEFLLGHTFEKVTVGSSIGFFIEGRSTLARLGLMVVKTAMLVEPGHRDRTITLELSNQGPNSILLYPHLKIARVALFKLASPTTQEYDLKGKYRVQRSVGKPIFLDEFLID